MLAPCFAAMMPGAKVASIAQDGSDISSALQTLLNGRASSASRNIFFPRPSTRYQLNSRVDIAADGTALVTCGSPKITLTNATSHSLSSTSPLWRHNGLSPAVRCDGYSHFLWHGGGFSRDTGTAGSNETLFEVGASDFSVISLVRAWTAKHIAQIVATGSGVYANLCAVIDSRVADGANPGMRLGGTSIRSYSGRARCCGAISLADSGGTTGPIWAGGASGCFWLGGYTEGHSSSAFVFQNGCQRALTSCNQESVTDQDCQSGASATRWINSSSGISGAGSWYRWGRP